jgi:hypothetical protein
MESADVEQVRPLDALELGLRSLVEPGLELVKRRNNCEGSLDRVRSLVYVRGMARPSLEPDPRPQDARRDKIHGAVGRLADEDAVRARPGETGCERPVAAALFLDDALVDHGAWERAGRQRSFDREEHGRDAPLHVAGAASVEAPVLDHASVRGPRPPVGGFLAHDVHMAVKEQRGPIAPRHRADDAAPSLVRDERDAAVGMTHELLGVELDREDLAAQVAESLLDERLCGLLLPEDVADPNEVLQEPDGGRERLLDSPPGLGGLHARMRTSPSTTSTR